MKNMTYLQMLRIYDQYLSGQTDLDIKMKGEKYIRKFSEDGNKKVVNKSQYLKLK